MMALKMILVKVVLSDISFVLGVAKETVLARIERAVQRTEEMNIHVLRDLPVTKVQLDNVWSFIRRKRAQQAHPDGESTDLSTDEHHGVWISFAPQCHLILAMVVGRRTLQSALLLMQMTAVVIRGSSYFFRNGLWDSLPTLIERYHTLKTFPWPGKRGQSRQPVKEPHPELVYGQVVRIQQQKCFKKLVYCVRCDAGRLEELGLAISTSLIERLNLTWRHALAPLVRKSWSFCKERTQMETAYGPLPSLQLRTVAYEFARAST